MKDWVQVIAACITSSVTLIGFFITAKMTTRNMRQTLDGSSDWRKSLFKVCSKKKISMDDIHLLRTSLRYAAYPSESKEYCFNWFSSKSIEFCNSLIARDYCLKENEKDKELDLDYSEQEITRLIIRCLLKNHWEYSNGFYTRKEKYNAQENEVIKVTTNNIRKFTEIYFQSEEKMNGEQNSTSKESTTNCSMKEIFEKLQGEQDGNNKEQIETQIETQIENNSFVIKYSYLVLLISLLFLTIVISFFMLEDTGKFLCKPNSWAIIVALIIDVFIILGIVRTMQLEYSESKNISNILLYSFMPMISIFILLTILKVFLQTNYEILPNIIFIILKGIVILIPLGLLWGIIKLNCQKKKHEKK